MAEETVTKKETETNIKLGNFEVSFGKKTETTTSPKNDDEKKPEDKSTEDLNVNEIDKVKAENAEKKDDELAASMDDEKEPNYKQMVKKKRNYEKEAESMEIAVGQIAEAISAGIQTYATGDIKGLLDVLKSGIIDVSWKQEKSDEAIVEHFFKDNTYLYIEITRKIEQSSKGVGPFKKNKTKIEVDVKYVYIEAGNNCAAKILQELVHKQTTDAMSYINEQPGWSDKSFTEKDDKKDDK